MGWGLLGKGIGKGAVWVAKKAGKGGTKATAKATAKRSTAKAKLAAQSKNTAILGVKKKSTLKKWGKGAMWGGQAALLAGFTPAAIQSGGEVFGRDPFGKARRRYDNAMETSSGTIFDMMDLNQDLEEQRALRENIRQYQGDFPGPANAVGEMLERDAFAELLNRQQQEELGRVAKVAQTVGTMEQLALRASLDLGA